LWAAQVRGVCVSGCKVPQQKQQQQRSPQNSFDPKLILTGVATDIRGDVTLIYPTGERVKATAQTPLLHGTRIITGPGARAVFKLVDDTSFTMHANGEMVIDDFVYDPDISFKKMSIRLAKGVFRYITGKVAPRDYSNMKVNIPVGCICIRGTDFEAFIDPFGSGRVVLHDGRINFEEYDTGRVFPMQAGQTLRYENFQIVGVN
jgi:hypothetical protein